MPTYEYEVTSQTGAKRVESRLCRVDERDLVTWPETGEPCRRLVSSYSLKGEKPPEDQAEGARYRRWYEKEMREREARHAS